MTPLMSELLARDRRREMLDAAASHRLGHELRRPAHAPTRALVLAFVWVAEAVARRLDRMADRALLAGEGQPARRGAGTDEPHRVGLAAGPGEPQHGHQRNGAGAAADEDRPRAGLPHEPATDRASHLELVADLDLVVEERGH